MNVFYLLPGCIDKDKYSDFLEYLFSPCKISFFHGFLDDFDYITEDCVLEGPSGMSYVFRGLSL